MKTPEEVKAGLEHCLSDAPCMKCPYYEFRDRRYTCEGLLMADASTHIRQLEAQIGEGANIHRWISAKDRTPESGDVVMVLASGKPRENITLENAYLIASYWKGEGWIVDGYEGWESVEVSFWMPLPDEPWKRVDWNEVANG